MSGTIGTAIFDGRYSPEPMSGCWLWTGATNRSGYGQVGAEGRTRLAHRLSFQVFVGSIPEGINVLHRCDTPPCINPAHLFLGSQADNVADAMRKGRYVPAAARWAKANPQRMARFGERNGSAKLTQTAADAIRAEYACGDIGQRALARKWGVSHFAIGQIVLGRTWSDRCGMPQLVGGGAA